MESSEDDAGAATIASRRASAREKDLGPREEVDATASALPETSRARTPGEMGTMSEDNFDGDSVPSPSSHDVNTSTEAILDMIDEFVDGPGAPKRLPNSLDDTTPAAFAAEPEPTPAPPAPCEPTEPSASTSQPENNVATPTESAKIECAPIEPTPEIPIVGLSECEALTDNSNTSKHEEPQTSSSIPETSVTVETVPEASIAEPEPVQDCPALNIPSSSIEESVPSIPEISESESNDRTVKCVTSSDNRDNVTVESAESTSSDVSVSEGRSVVAESATRSPLRRRLIRPTPYDRRPDTTVSSTVDSRSSDVHLTEQTSSESVAKDVSSSSDVILPVHGNIKDEEISNVSEISVCKAETSTNPPKKIKLIRQKITPSTSLSEVSLEQPLLPPESESPSTSSVTLTPAVPESCSSDCISTTENNDDVKIDPSPDCVTATTIPVPVLATDGQSNDNKSQDTSNQGSDELDQSSCVPESPSKVSEDNDVQKKVPPIRLNLSASNSSEPIVNDASEDDSKSTNSAAVDVIEEIPELSKQVPKLTIKLGSKPSEEMKSPIPKLTIKPIKPPEEVKDESINCNEPVPSIPKISIKPILRPPEKINDIHRKSSSSEISESECSENDESASASDQASTSDQGTSDIIPKVTIKLGKAGTDCEGKFYTKQNVPKLTITGIQQNEQEESEPASKLKLVISQSEDKQLDKIPKLTIKTVAKTESQLSPKLTIKSIKTVDTSGTENTSEEAEQPVKSKTLEIPTSSGEAKESAHVPKITIKPVVKTDSEHIPVVTKLNIKPILKPTENEISSEELEDEVPVVSKLNIKPVIKPKDSQVDSNVEDIPKVTKLNIKPLKSPVEKSSEEKDCDEWNADSDENSIPVVTKLNIKPIVKPLEEETIKDSENQSSETGNSSDDNADIPVVTKLNIKPIVKPTDLDSMAKPNTSSEPSIPIVTKINIKPIVKPEDNAQPSSPKKENMRFSECKNSEIPIVTKLNIKPLIKPEETEQQKPREGNEELSPKNPPLVMKINMKAVAETSTNDNLCKVDKKLNSIEENTEKVYNNIHENIPIVSKINIKPITKPIEMDSSKIKADIITNDLKNCKPESSNVTDTIQSLPCSVKDKITDNCISESVKDQVPEHCKILQMQNDKDLIHKLDIDNKIAKDVISVDQSISNMTEKQEPEKDCLVSESNRNEHITNTIMKMDIKGSVTTSPLRKQQSSLTNCALLKKLLENTKQEDMDAKVSKDEVNQGVSNCEQSDRGHSSKDADFSLDPDKKLIKSPYADEITKTTCLNQTLSNKIENDNITRPLEINISEKITTQSSGQDSPRIILKINKTDHGSSAQIITEEVKKPEVILERYSPDNTQETLNDRQAIKRGIVNSRKKGSGDVSPSVALGKRLRSSRIVQESDKSPVSKRNIGKRATLDTSPPQSKEPQLSVLEAKRLKLGQLLSNKSLTITSVTKAQNTSPPSKNTVENKQTARAVNHTLLNNENCSKNGNSKLHNILSNLHAKQMVTLPLNDIGRVEKPQTIIPELDSSTSTGSSDVVEITPIENSHPQVQEMIINENSESHDFTMSQDDVSQDPLEMDNIRTNEILNDSTSVSFTPQPKKRGRPRKIPLSEGAKTITLPTPALEERPQRSLRLTRDRPAILVKPRGRGRGRGAKRACTPPKAESVIDSAANFFTEDRSPEDIDPTSSRVKLPRMTEALDKMPSVCTTPLSSRTRDSACNTDIKMFTDTPELKVVLENTLPKLEEAFMKSPETPSGESKRGWRGGRGGRGRGRAAVKTPRGRGRGRGGGRGAMYMKETMGIYGRVCGPATTTVHLFEEETCMMDDNATPAKPSHLLDEDSQSSVKSSTNESSKMRKSKFADLFDSNKVWTAADVKEYMWPPLDRPNCEPQVMMIQEQVAMFLGVKSFKRRYPELKRRTVGGEERDFILGKGLVTEALCDLGVTAVDASEVLDIMLSDYPHKYEEYRSHQRAKQMAGTTSEENTTDGKDVPRIDKVEMKIDSKPEPPKIDPEKTRQDMALAAMASASEWNARLNSLRRPACVDLQTMTVHRRRAPPPAPAAHVRPPAGFYPHALLPGQYQHTYRVYTPEQLRYFPLNTVLAAPPAPASASESSSESEADWGSRADSSDEDSHQPAKRKKLTKVKRSSVVEPKEEPRDEELCRACKLREEGNRKYSHERFLVCSNCNGRLHPSCVDLSADTIRKCREYAWQCAECKTCCGCRLPADDDKMLFCDLCDRGFHIYCVGLDRVPSGRWHCVECAICKSCGARDPNGHPPGSSATPATPGTPGTPATPLGSISTAGGGEWHHQTRRGPGGHKLYSHSLCTPCARVR